MPNIEMSVKGKKVSAPAIYLDGEAISVKGNFIKIAEIFDEYWIEKRQLPDPLKVINALRDSGLKPDLLTFTQRVPDTTPRYSFAYEWRNYAVVELNSYDQWFNKQTSSAVRRNIKASAKRGIEVKVCQFDESYVNGIMSIYNESPIRQGRKFWHYGKKISDVFSENGTYCDRSTFLAAYFENEMVGYCKVVWDESTAAIMQILSKIKFYDKRPNNALLAEAVRQCCLRRIPYLIYESFVYGKKNDNSLTEFKRSNGFVRMDVPQFFVPLTPKGTLILKLGLHKNLKEKLPYWITSRLIDLRAMWYSKRVGIK